MKKINKSKLESSDFAKRFLAFIEEYDQTFDTSVLIFARTWIETENYDSIKYFLMFSPYDAVVPISKKEFIEMTIDELVELQNSTKVIYQVLDRKNSLYKEFHSYYE